MRAYISLFCFLFSFSTLTSACSFGDCDPSLPMAECPGEVVVDDDDSAAGDDDSADDDDVTPGDDDSTADDDDATPQPDDDDTTPPDDDTTPGDDDSAGDDDDSASDDDSAGTADDDDSTPDPDADGDGYTEVGGDCDDSEASVYPGAAEIMDDGIDQDCDGIDSVTPAPTSQECWDAIAFQIQYRSIDWSIATTVSGDWVTLQWVDTDPVQVLDAYTSSNVVNVYSSCGGSLEQSLYLPDSYVFPDLGDQYNNGIATLLQPSGVVYEINYLADCGDGSWSGWVMPDSSPLDACDSGIDATRWLGAHGGSHITATQALREGELTGSSTIGRPLPVEVDHTHLYFGSDGYRWPAASADSYASSLYSGSIPDLQMGSILVLPETYDCTSMTTTPGTRLCEVARDHGFVVVDDSYGPDEVAFPMTPEAQAEAEADLGYSLHNSQDEAFGGDVEDIFADLMVLTNPETAWVE